MGSCHATTVTTALAVLRGLAGLYFGFNFLLNPHAADAFGITPWPTGVRTRRGPIR